MALTFDDSTIAAMPGGISIDKSKFLSYYKVRGLWKLYYSNILNKNLELLNEKYPKNAIVQEWIHLNEHFQFGCANPALIINKQKGIYAAYTDLTNDGGTSTPVIKIVQLKNNLIKKLDLNDLDKSVSVAMYYQKLEEMNSRAWNDFNPLLPELFTKDKSSCQKLKEKIKDEAWKCLDIGLSQIENKELPGLYHVKIAPDLTQNAY